MEDLLAVWRDEHQMEVNLAVFCNLMNALGDASAKLQHVSLLQGAKAYGGHVEPV